jgi:hypothetical protein
MHGSMNVKFPNNTSKWQMEFNSAFKGLIANFYMLPAGLLLIFRGIISIQTAFGIVGYDI